jgi:hypothetical protein
MHPQKHGRSLFSIPDEDIVRYSPFFMHLCQFSLFKLILGHILRQCVLCFAGNNRWIILAEAQYVTAPYASQGCRQEKKQRAR